MRHITIGILAHVDAGKTTLSECMLYLSGQIRKLGRVDHKNGQSGDNASGYTGACGFLRRNGAYLAGTGLCDPGDQRS